MSTSRFTTLTHALSAATTRRDVSRGLAVLPLVGVLTSRPGGGEAKGRKRKKHKKKGNDQTPPPSDQCLTMVNGAVCGNGGCLVCLGGVCAPNPQNDAPCGADGTGRCYSGTCNELPTCNGFDSFCLPGDTTCCNGPCLFGVCGFAAAGVPCKQALDCISGTCTGYRCQ